MAKRVVLPILIIFIIWCILDWITHGVILAPTYKATESLWRPHEQMNYALIYVTSLVAVTAFVLIYVIFVARKSMVRALLYSLIYGLGVSLPMGYASYATMPIPYFMAFVWCWGSVVEFLAGGLVLGLMVRDEGGS